MRAPRRLLLRGRLAWAGLVGQPVVPLAAEGFLSRLSFGIVSLALPLLAYRLGMGLAAIGILLSLNLVVAMALKPVMGRVADRVGPKPALLAAIGLRSAVCLVLVLAAEPWHLVAARALHGLSIALRDPSAAVLVADAGGEHRVASAFAWYQTAKTVAGSVGRAVAGVLVTASGGFAVAFVVAFILSAAPLAVVARGVRGAAMRAPAPVSPVKVGSGGTTVPGGPARSPVLAFASVGFLVTGSAYLLANLFPIFATEYAGLSPAAVGGIYLAGAVLALSGPVWGWLADRVSHRLVLSLRSIANMGSSVVYLVAPNLGGVLAGKVLDDTGKAAFRPAWGSLMAHVANQDRSRRARVLAWLSVGEDAGEVAGPVVAGLVWSAWGIPAVLVLRLVAAAAAEVVTVAVARRHAPDLEPPAPAGSRRPGLERTEPERRGMVWL
ncbi:MAG TPA: MFS transporter [Acidimicrobiales bacterium]|nr:MFS transporter [Acidimicrobiales bacterium]